MGIWHAPPLWPHLNDNVDSGRGRHTLGGLSVDLTHSHDGCSVDRPLSRALLHLWPEELLVCCEAK